MHWLLLTRSHCHFATLLVSSSVQCTELTSRPAPFHSIFLIIFFSTPGAAADDAGAADASADDATMEAAIAAAINGGGANGTVADLMGNPAIMEALQVRNCNKRPSLSPLSRSSPPPASVLVPSSAARGAEPSKKLFKRRVTQNMKFES